ncbi:GTP cyclohydrolase [Gilvibacter sp.]|uniref:GTP cyclohydrolase n=1 Tax=Gilvibacter sp. TaxID=2729997 RepID=UPI0035BE61D4
MQKLADTTLKTRFGLFTETLFADTQQEIICLHMGNLKGANAVYCRLHSSCIYGHYFNSLECDCQQQMDQAMQQIAAKSAGIIVLLDQEGKGNGHLALIKSKAFKAKGLKQAEAYQAAGYPAEARDFTAAAQVLASFEMASVNLDSSNEHKRAALISAGIKIEN